MVRALLLAAAGLTLAPAAAPAQVVYAWGANGSGLLGNGTTTNSTVPVAVSTAGVLNGLTVTAIAGAGSHSVAVANGQVFAWGQNNNDQLGNGTTTNSSVPVAVSTAGVLNGQTVTAIAGGQYHSLALANGRVFSWGYNAYGQLGNGTTTNSNVPVAVSTAGVLNGKTVTAISGGGNRNLAVANGQVFAWGLNTSGQLGNGTMTNSNVPVAVSTAGVLNGLTITAVAAGVVHSLAVANGQVYAWGYNGNGELGNGTTTNSNVPVAVSTAGALNGLTVTAVAGGGLHTLAVANGQVFAWGYNGLGQLGNGSSADSHMPVAVASSVLNSLLVTEVAAGQNSSYALTSNGRLFAWGDNTFGELGIGSSGGPYSTPQEVRAPTGYLWTSVASDAEGTSVLAIATPVPEPGTLGLVAAAGLAALGFRRRKGRCAAGADTAGEIGPLLA